MAKNTMGYGSSFYCSIDNNETQNLKYLLNKIFCHANFVETFLWTRTSTPPALSNKSRKTTEYVHCYENGITSSRYSGDLIDNGDAPLLNSGNPVRDLVFPAGSIRFNISDGLYECGQREKVSIVKEFTVKNGTNKDPVVLRGEFKWQQSFLDNEINNGTTFIVKSDRFSIRFQRVDSDKTKPPKNMLDIELNSQSDVGTNETASAELSSMGLKSFSYAKPVSLIKKLFKFNSFSGGFFLDFFAGTGTSGDAVINLIREDELRRKYVLIEQGYYFDDILKLRIQKSAYSSSWVRGEPDENDSGSFRGISHCFKYIRLESYEDTLNNLALKRSKAQQGLFDSLSPEAQAAKEAYLLNYMLNVEARDSDSLLNINKFSDPSAYELKVKSPSGDETKIVNVDLLETFNWLLGLDVDYISAPIHFNAKFSQGEYGRWQAEVKRDEKGKANWWFRTVSGVNRKGQKVLVVWRNLPSVITEEKDALVKDNAVLDAVLIQKLQISLTESPDDEFDILYVNGDHNITIPKRRNGEEMEARILSIEESFHRLMFAGDNQ